VGGKIKHSVATQGKNLKEAKGYWGTGKQCRQRAALMHALVYAYRDRVKKSSALWIARIAPPAG
jgi:ribosomal protein L20